MKYKKHIVVILIISLIFYCRYRLINHSIPIANIEFVKIEKNDEYENSFFLYFSSDIELIENLKKEHNIARVKCFFLNKSIDENDFAAYKGYQLRSVRDLILVSEMSNQYTYKIKASVKDNRSNIGSEEKTEKVMTAIAKFMNEGNLNCLSCVATSVAYMNIPKRYISKTMCLPKEELKKVMK